MTPKLAFFVYPKFDLLDLSGRMAAFQMAGFVGDRKPYQIKVISAKDGSITSAVGVKIPTSKPKAQH